jgi:hypothetical protein
VQFGERATVTVSNRMCCSGYKPHLVSCAYIPVMVSVYILVMVSVGSLVQLAHLSMPADWPAGCSSLITLQVGVFRCAAASLTLPVPPAANVCCLGYQIRSCLSCLLLVLCVIIPFRITDWD